MHLLRKNIQKIIEVDDKEFETVLSYFEPVSFKKGQQIIKPGDIVTYEYFVLSGCLKAFYLNDNIKMHILQFAMPEWWTTDYDAHYNNTKATFYLDCIEHCDLLRLSAENRDKLCNDLPKMQYFFRIRTNRGYVAAQQRVLSLLNNNAREKYEKMLAMYPNLFQKVPRTLIAAYLGVTRETLSRLYSKKNI